MSVFGFIENFFFISLALVFVLVLLLVYHFKTRITVAEKKSESMYGLLTAVVKEIKTLRGMFGLSGSGGDKDETNTLNDVVKSKIIPETDMTFFLQNDSGVNKTSVGITETDTSNQTVETSTDYSSNNNTFLDFVEKREVITFEFAATEKGETKIVVSDFDSDSEDDESDSDLDSDSDSESDDEEDRDHIPQNTNDNLPELLGRTSDSNFEVKEVFDDRLDLGVVDFTPEESVFQEISIPPEYNLDTRTDNDIQEQDITTQLAAEESQNVIDMDVNDLDNREDASVPVPEQQYLEDSFQPEDNAESKETAVDLNSINPKIHTSEQLKKMNINQLRTIASQLGITIDITKMKKPELISLIGKNAGEEGGR